MKDEFERTLRLFKQKNYSLYISYSQEKLNTYCRHGQVDKFPGVLFGLDSSLFLYLTCTQTHTLPPTTCAYTNKSASWWSMMKFFTTTSLPTCMLPFVNQNIDSHGQLGLMLPCFMQISTSVNSHNCIHASASVPTWLDLSIARAHKDTKEMPPTKMVVSRP